MINDVYTSLETCPLVQQQSTGLINSLSRRSILTLAGGSLAALLLPGCGGGGGESSANIQPFTVTPSRGAPGTMVTLTGLSLPSSVIPTIMFGNQPAIIHHQDASGLQVLVPAFFQAGTTAIMQPGAPVPVTAQVGNITRPASNTFTVDALPLAPGTAAVLAQSMGDTASFFQDLAQNGLFAALDDGSGAVAPLDRAGAIQAAAFASAVADVWAGPTNPNCFLNVLNGTAPLNNGAKFPMDVVDALLAQGPAGGLLSDFAQTIHDAIYAIAPDAIVTKSAGRSASRGAPFSFGSFSIDWTKMAKAQAIIVTLQVQAFLAQAANSNSANLLSAIYGVGMTIIKLVAAVTQPELLPLLEATDIVMAVGSALLSNISVAMPGKISGVWVVVNNVKRFTNGPPVNIALTISTPLKMMIQTQSVGGAPTTIAGLAALALTIAENKCKPLKTFLEGLSAAQTKIIYDIYITRMLSTTNYVWQAMSGSSAPAQWQSTTAMNFPAITYPAVDVNSARVITVSIPKSINLLATGVDANNAYYLTGLHFGTNAGYTATLSTKALVPGLPSLGYLAGTQQQVIGVVNIVAAAANVTVG